MVVTYSATAFLHIVHTFESRPNRPVTRSFSTFWNVIICQFWEAAITHAGLVDVFGGTCFNTYLVMSLRRERRQNSDWAFTKLKTVSLTVKYED
jgi:hypothetical protein